VTHARVSRRLGDFDPAMVVHAEQCCRGPHSQGQYGPGQPSRSQRRPPR
jgi:hypothetical protein